jgi:hypothetical protein
MKWMEVGSSQGPQLLLVNRLAMGGKARMFGSVTRQESRGWGEHELFSDPPVQPASGLVVNIASRAAEFVEVIDAVIEALLLCSSIRMDGAAGVLRRPHRVAVIPACLVNRGDLSLTITPAAPATTITFSIVNSTGLCRQYSFRLCQLLLRLLLRR